jgi:lipoprotein NlpD
MYEGKPGYYIVKMGDTVMQVSRITGQKPADIVAWNNLSHPNELKVGQVLRVAPPGQDGAAAGEWPADTQTGGVAPRSVEMTPLVANKSLPRGEKQPYADTTLAEMQQNPDYAPTLASAQAAPSGTSQMTTSTAAPVAAKTWAWPARGNVVSAFSDNQSKGIDIGGKMGDAVVAAAEGRVTHVGPLRGYGNMVIIKHSDSLNTVYAHNKAILVKEGDAVKQGQQIAEMGNSDSDVVKLRFEVREYGKPVNPAQYLPPR